MKIYTTLLLAPLLLSNNLFGMSWNAPESSYLEGSTQGKYKKPGAPIEMHYTTEHTEMGEEGTVAIELITTAKNNVMQVSIKLDPQLQSVGNFTPQQIFNLEPAKTNYPLNFVVSSQNEGRYYIRISVKIEGKGIRNFAVPVNVGDVSVNPHQSNMRKNSRGENISVSPAEETIIKK